MLLCFKGITKCSSENWLLEEVLYIFKQAYWTIFIKGNFLKWPPFIDFCKQVHEKPPLKLTSREWFHVTASPLNWQMCF